MPIVKVLLQENEDRALLVLARQERRDPRVQAAVLIREGLERIGLLSPQNLTTLENEV